MVTYQPEISHFSRLDLTLIEHNIFIDVDLCQPELTIVFLLLSSTFALILPAHTASALGCIIMSSFCLMKMFPASSS